MALRSCASDYPINARPIEALTHIYIYIYVYIYWNHVYTSIHIFSSSSHAQSFYSQHRFRFHSSATYTVAMVTLGADDSLGYSTRWKNETHINSIEFPFIYKNPNAISIGFYIYIYIHIYIYYIYPVYTTLYHSM